MPSAGQMRGRWPRAAAVWLLIALVETAHGLLRRALVLPWAGEALAHRIGVATGAVLVLATTFACIRWMGLVPVAGATPQEHAALTSAQWQVGAAWVLAMLAFEFGLGQAAGVPAERVLAEYDPRRGGWMLAGMATLAAAPWLSARLRQGARR